MMKISSRSHKGFITWGAGNESSLELHSYPNGMSCRGDTQLFNSILGPFSSLRAIDGKRVDSGRFDVPGIAETWKLRSESSLGLGGENIGE
jgi:hypothetical protein